MRTKPPPDRPLGITRRIALLSWLITIVTLVIFVGMIIPEQKRTHLESLESKARGISASLQDVIAGGVVTEDYSSVVDHCKQVLQGDRTIAFLIITKNDGFSLIHQSGGITNSVAGTVVPLEAQWRTDTLNDFWRPGLRTVQSGIEAVPVVNQRLFHYARPFDYSGIEWGWIHVGLSLNAYDQSVRGVYRRTLLLAVLCLLFSLGVSVIYARRLLRPLHQLNQVVSRVSAGDLAARADICSGDEIQDLAQSFNGMTDALLERDRILESVRIAAQQFLSTADWRQVINGVLAQIGQSAAFSRVYLFENHLTAEGAVLSSQRYEWAAAGVIAYLDDPQLQGFDWPGAGFQATARRLNRGEMISQFVRQLSPEEQAVLRPQGIQSILMVPIVVEGRWWGLLGVDECARERQWTEAERDSLRTVAEMLGAAIARHITQEALLEAKSTLEQRVLERTRELQEQITAKDKAHAELAEAQQRLMETSRLAGMAEVATGVLHNVGNVLNSVSVSATLVGDRLRQSKITNLRRATSMLREQNGHLAEFLTNDPKGRLLPEYLVTVAEQLSTEQTRLIEEISSVGQHIEHIKEIVAMQQSYAKVSGAFENLSPSALVEDALQMNVAAFARHRIGVVREFEENVPPVCVDRHKVLQILINLLRNAKYAMDQQHARDKQLVLRVSASGPDRVRISIRDNGVGIAPENLIKIFSHGFTTKKDGHGFGLHSGANAAKEMGGCLAAQSDGLGRGATFTLELPTHAARRESTNSSRTRL